MAQNIMDTIVRLFTDNKSNEGGSDGGGYGPESFYDILRFGSSDNNAFLDRILDGKTGASRIVEHLKISSLFSTLRGRIYINPCDLNKNEISITPLGMKFCLPKTPRTISDLDAIGVDFINNFWDADSAKELNQISNTIVKWAPGISIVKVHDGGTAIKFPPEINTIELKRKNCQLIVMNGYHIKAVDNGGEENFYIVAGINRAEDYVGGRLRMVDSDDGTGVFASANSIKYYDAVGFSFHPEWGGGGCQLIIVDPDKHSDWTDTVMLNGNTITEPNNDWTTYMRVNHLPVEDVMFYYVRISEVIEALYEYNANSESTPTTTNSESTPPTTNSEAATGNIRNIVRDLAENDSETYDNCRRCAACIVSQFDTTRRKIISDYDTNNDGSLNAEEIRQMLALDNETMEGFSLKHDDKLVYYIIILVLIVLLYLLNKKQVDLYIKKTQSSLSKQLKKLSK